MKRLAKIAREAHRLALPLGTVVESIVGLNTELEVAMLPYYNHTSHRYSIQIQSMLLTQHGTATNFYGDACLCAWHPYERHYILSLDCQSTLLLHDSWYDVRPTSRDRSKSC